MRRPYTRYPCGVYGPRNLVRRHAQRLKKRMLAEANGTVADEPPRLPPGQEQLFSFWAPALEAGEYTVTVEQDINTPSTSTNEKLHLPEKGLTAATQTFDVVAPRYSLPDGAIHSSFPPQGYGALANTLPHVVLSDPHLPWARIASTSPSEKDPEYTRNMVPWLALLVFTQDELKLSATQLSTMFAKTSLGTTASQTQTFTTNVPIKDVPNIMSTISPITALTPEASDDLSTDVIFVPSTLFSELVTKYNTDGEPDPQTGPDVSRYKYLAHLRDINTEGMADSGEEYNGVFGIVVSHRVGPLSNTQPQPVVAHLVSIEGIESQFMDQHWPIDPTAVPYVVLSSIYSWNFVTLPEKSFNIESTFVSLGTRPNGLDLLRAPDAVINNVDVSTVVGARMKARLQDGYTMTKYRTITGEQTAAIYRGPLTPTLVRYPLLPDQAAQTGTTWLSNSGIDLQIMDPEVGIMDITYSVAWQLGRTLAVSDSNFTTSLGKLRTAIYNGGMNGAKAEILRQRGSYETRQEAIVSLTKTLPELNWLHKQKAGLHATNGSMADRWYRPQAEAPNLSYYGPLVQEIFDRHAALVAGKMMLSPDGDGSQRYDEQNTAASVDWMVVLKWVLDKMFLYSVPAHYLIIDPSYLPQESLRFFHVDRNWTDALIDGALSLGNHMEGVDKTRLAIHAMIKSYLQPESPLTPVPQVPTYGFLMHSEAVTKYPDLKVTVELAHVTEATLILRQENLDVVKGVMLCLLDQLPGDPGLKSITFTEPPHQQSFIAGGELDSHHIKTLYKQIFTANDQPPNPTPWSTFQWMRPDDPNPPRKKAVAQDPKQDDVPHSKYVFKWGVETVPEIRTLIPTSWASDVNGVLNTFGKDGGKYADDTPNAAMAGIQLDNPMYRLKIAIPEPSAGDESLTLQRARSTSEEAVVSFPPVLESVSASPLVIRHGEQGDEIKEGGESSEDRDGKDASSESYNRTSKKPSSNIAMQSAPRIDDGFTLGSSHGYPNLPPPHYRPVLSPEVSPFPQGRDLPKVGPSAPPQYTYTVLPIDNDPTNPGVPCGTDIPKDLVFSIVQETYTGSQDYLLEELQINLQLATGGPSDSACLLKDYSGPGPVMASNVRFVVLSQVLPPTPEDPSTYLSLRVVPRSTKGSAVPNMCSEMTFILPVCVILPHNVRIKIPIYTTEMYRGFTPVPQTNYYAISFQTPPT